MQKIGIMTDSSCDLTQQWLNDNHVAMLPLQIIYKDREYRDRVEISADEIYSHLTIEVPKTSLPSPEDVFEAINNFKAQGCTHVIGLFISSGLSGTFNMISQLLQDEKELPIGLIDTKSLSLGLGFCVMNAVKAINEGKTYDELMAYLQELPKRIKAYYVLNTLEYLKKGGRIGQVEGTVGELLSIKPIISVNEEGVYYTVKKVRGRQKSIAALIEIVTSNKYPSLRVGILHGAAQQEALEMEKTIRGQTNIKEVYLDQISPVLTVHTGPGLLGLVVEEL